MVIGCSGSGKTRWVAELVKNWNRVVDTDLPLTKFRLIYSVYQPVYDDIIGDLPEGCEIETASELPPSDVLRSDHYWRGEGAQILFLDDLLPRLDKSLGEILETLFCIRSHHNKIVVICTAQSLFKNNIHLRSCLRNSNYLTLLPSPQNANLLVQLQKQLFPSRPGTLVEIAKTCYETDKNRYLLLDCTTQCPSDFRIRSGLFPGERGVIYQYSRM